jgi:hypothetical protein
MERVREVIELSLEDQDLSDHPPVRFVGIQRVTVAA